MGVLESITQVLNEFFLLFLVGLTVGSIGVGLVIALGKATFDLLNNFI